MRFRLSFWHRDHPGAQPGDVVDVPDHQVDALVKAGIGHPVDEPEQPAEAPSKAAAAQEPNEPASEPQEPAQAADQPTE